MGDMRIMIFMLVAIVIFGIIGVVFILKMDKQSRSAAKAGMKKKTLIPIPRYLKMADSLQKNFLTRGGYMKIQGQVAMLSVYSATEIKIESVKFFLMSNILMTVLIVLGALLFKQVFTTLLVIAFAIVVKSIMVDKQIDKVHFRLLHELSRTLSSIRQNYLRTNMIPDSIAEAEKGILLGKPLEDIFNILSLTEGEKRLDEFIATCPFRILQTLAGVCYHINEVGDSKDTDSEATSDFINALNMIGDEVNLEIQRIVKQKAKFGHLEFLPVIPLPFIAIVEMYFSGIIPGTSILYKGMLGYISRLVIVLLGIIGYVAITRINRAVTVAPDDRISWVQDLLQIEIVSRFVDRVKPKRQDKLNRIAKQLRGALSQKTDRDMTLESIIYAAFAFLVAIIAIISTINLSREFIYNNVGSLSLMSSENLTADDIDMRRRMDIEFLMMPTEPTTAWTISYVSRKFPDMPEFDRQEQEHRLLTKYRSYHGTKFSWWMILIAYFFAGVASKGPQIMLAWRKWLLTTETEEDVLQMQTIIAILMNTPIDTLDTIEWLARQSKIHKSALITCFHEYASNPELALERLKSSSSSVVFQRIVDKLMLTIHQISLKESFSDLISERSHVLRVREINQDAILAKRRSLAGILAVSPLGALAVLHLLLPIGILGFRELSQAMSNISF